MKERTLPGLAGAIAVALVVGAVQLARADGDGQRRSARAADQSQTTTSAATVLEPARATQARLSVNRSDSAKPDPAREDVSRPRRIDGLRFARRVARRFLGALLLTERGRGGRGARRVVRALTTRSLGDRLVAEPPRIPGASSSRVAAGRLESLELLSASRGRIELAAAIRRGEQRSGMVLRLTGRGDRWLVSDIR